MMMSFHVTLSVDDTVPTVSINIHLHTQPVTGHSGCSLKKNQAISINILLLCSLTHESSESLVWTTCNVQRNVSTCNSYNLYAMIDITCSLQGIKQ